MSANSETEGEVPASTDGRATLRYSSTLRWPSVDVDALRGCLPAFAAPPIFRGLDHEDPMDWLEAYERAAHFNRWNNATKLYFVFFYLEETAYAWSQLDQQSRTASWHTGSAEQPGFVDQFCARFCTLGWVEKWGADLNGTFQGPDESVESFCFRVLRLCRRIDPDGEHGDLLQRQAIYRGVDQALAVAVKLQLSQPLDEMIEQLRCAEKIFSRPKRAPSREEDYFMCGRHHPPVDDRRRHDGAAKVPGAIATVPSIALTRPSTPPAAPISPGLAAVTTSIAYPSPVTGTRRHSKEPRRSEAALDPVEAFLATL